MTKHVVLEEQPPREAVFMAFTGDDWHSAVKTFEDKYHVEPSAIFKSKRVLYVGPIPPAIKRNPLLEGDDE